MRRSTETGETWRWLALTILFITFMGMVSILLFLGLRRLSSQMPPLLSIQINPPLETAPFIDKNREETVVLTSQTPVTTGTPDPSPTATDSPVPTREFTPTPPPTITAEPVEIQPTQTPPENAQVIGVLGHAQLFTLDCEARSAADWASFFGNSIDELEFLDRLPRSLNPDLGFVGNVHDPQGQIPPRSYGVHAGPVATLLRAYGVSAFHWKKLPFELLKAEIAAGRPVIAWVIYGTTTGWPVEYHSPDGSTTTVAHFEHTVIVTGYDSDSVTIIDGNQLYFRSTRRFLESWAVLGNMAITATNPYFPQSP